MNRWAWASVWIGLALAASSAAAQSDFVSPRDYLETFGLDDAFWSALADERPLSAAERDAIGRGLYRLRRAAPADVQLWSQSPAPLPAVVQNPPNHRGAWLVLRGRVERVRRQELSPGDRARLELEGLYRCEMKTDDGRRVAILTGNVPRAWPLERTFSEAASVRGVFLKLARPDDSADQPPLPLLFAARVAWHPSTPLGRLGMDVGLLDAVRDRQPLSDDEHEVFYQLLAAAGRADHGDLLARAAEDLARLATDLRAREAAAPPEQRDRLRHARRLAERGRTDVEPLFNRPLEQHGRLVLLEGTAVRAIEIRVDNRDLHQRLGIERYFELEMVTEDSQNNPLAVCLRELPPEMPRGVEISQPVRLAAFYFKQWRYPTRVSPRGPGEGRQYQLTPLLVGRSLVWSRAPSAGRQIPYTALVVGLPLAALAGLVAWKWLTGGRRGAAAVGVRFELPQRVALDQGPREAPEIDSSG